LPDLPSGGSLNFTITVLLDADLAAGVQLVNDATVGGTTSDPNPGNNQDDAPVILTRSSDLATTKIDQVDPVAAGETLSYTIQVQNNGPSDAANVVVVDTLPAGTSFVSSTGGCIEAPLGTLTCALGALADGASTSFDVVVTVDAAVSAGTVLVNGATADSDSSDEVPGNNSDSESTLVEAVADLRILKTALDSTPLAGGSFAYTIEVTNGGPSVATNVTVVDVLPAGLSYISDTGGCVEGPADTLTCSLGSLAPGASSSFNVVVAVDASVADGTVITNVATVSTSADDPDSGNDSDDAEVTVDTEANLALDKTAPSNAEPGQQINYTLTIDNNGPSDAVGVTVTDTLPAEVSYVGAVGATCVESPAGTLVCDAGTIAAGDTLVITITVDIDGGVPSLTVITNSAVVGADTTDPDPSDNDDSANTTVEPRNEADLRLQKSALDAAPGVGELFSYQITIFNDGPRTATNVVVTDTLPAGVTYQFDSDACVQGPVGTLVCSAPNLVSGGSYGFTITVLADAGTPAGTQLTNTAETTSDIPDPDTGNNSDSATVTLQPRTDLRLQKSASSDPVAAGAMLTYTLTVFNDGPSPATGVTVTDTLPAGVSYVSDDGGCNSSGLPTLVCDLGSIGAGASASVAVVVTVDGGLSAGTQLSNSATAGGDQPDPDDGNNDAQETVDVERRTDLAISKSASHALRAPGQLVTFTLRVDNFGPSDATGVTLTDTLPAGLAYASDDAGCNTGALPQIVCDLGNLAAGAADFVTIVASVDLGASAGVVLDNVAVVGGDDPDPDGGNNSDDASVEVTALADLRVSKSGAGAVTTSGNPPGTAIIPDAVSAGRRLTYTLSVTNDGPSDATNVSLTDNLPAGVSYVSDDGGCNIAGLPQIVCSIGALANGATATVTLVVDVDADVADGAQLVNGVSVSGDEADPNGGNDNDTQTTTVANDADLELNKTASTDKAAVGGVITYTLSVQNLGPSDAAGVTLTDTLPAGVTYVSDDGGCNISGLPEIVCDLGALGAGAGATVEIVVTVNAGTEGQTLSNTAIVGLDDGDDPNPDNNDGDADVDVEQQLDLRLSKLGAGEVVTPGNPPGLTVIADRVTAGQLLTYTLSITNAGPATATGLVVEDTLPAGAGFIAADPACNTSNLPVLSCPLPDLASGASTTLAIVVGVDDAVPHGTLMDNSARVDADQVDSNPANNDDTQQTLVDSAADLTVMKTANPSTAGTGEQVTFTITAANAGPSTATGVTVSDTLPAALAYVSDDGGCDTSALPLVVCDLGDLGPGDLASVAIVVEVLTGYEDSVVSNTVIVGPSTGSDPDPSDNSDDEPVTIPPRVDLAVAKAGAGEVTVPSDPPGTAVVPNLVSAGRRLTYTLSVDNAGPSTATGVVLTDTLPAGVSLVSTSGASCSPTPPGVVCDLPDLAMGAGIVLTIVVDVDADVADGSALINAATVTSVEADATPGDNSVTQLTDVSADADLSVAKTAEPAIVASGELVTFTLTVRNQGPSEAQNVVLTDTLPSGMTDFAADPGCDLSGAPVVVCALGDLTPGAMVTLQITARPTVALETMIVTNVADVAGDTDDPNPADNHAEASFGVAIPVDLAVGKDGVGEVLTAGDPPGVSVLPGEVTAGGLITWTITVANAGLSTATGVVLTDTLPANVTHVSDDAGCDVSLPPMIQCDIGSLASGATASVTLTGLVKAVVPAGSILTNSVFVAADQMEMSTGDNSATHDTLVREQADLAVDKSADPPWLATNDEVIYTISVLNNGLSMARDVRITDTLPGSLTYVSDTDACVETPAASGVLVCQPGDLMPGDSTSFEIRARVEAGLTGQRVTNTVRVGLPAPAVDPNPANDEAEAGIDVVDPAQTADLSIKKSITSTLSMTGELITYTVFVSNNGPLLADDVVVTDVLSSSTDGMAELIDASHGGCTVLDASNMTCDLGDLASGVMVDYTVTARLNFVPPTGSHFVTNTVEVLSLTPDLDLSNNEAFAWFEIMGGSFMVGTAQDPYDTITLAWLDGWTEETEFRIEAQGAGSPWIPVAAIPSRSTSGVGDDYRWTSPRLPAGSRTAFRVVVHDPVAAAMAPLASVGRFADVEERPADKTGCYVGQLGLDGRSRHDGVILRLDGIPVARTLRGGDFRLCGVSPGLHDLATWQPGYLAVAARTSVAAGRATELPWVALPGGDIDGDGKVDLADLVLVGAAYGADVAEAETSLAAADVNGDRRVDLFDLVMVSGSYDRFGPVPWWTDASVPEVMAGAAAVPEVSGRPEVTLSLQSTAQEDGRYVVRLAARNVRDVFGADLRLRLDPTRARWVDVDPDEPGLQVAGGASWWTGGDDAAYVARNVADRDGASLRFAATRTRPATAMRGDLVLATVVLEPVGGETSPEEALSVISARLLTPGAQEIPVRVTGVEVSPPVGGGGAGTIYLPFVQQRR
jgi:uncharacterized repeat protein (TIGR01451 family)